jgi:hypothetical protein
MPGLRTDLVDGGCDVRLPVDFRKAYRLPHNGTVRKKMAFVIAVLLFVVVVGIVDAGLPWPDPKSKQHRP